MKRFALVFTVLMFGLITLTANTVNPPASALFKDNLSQFDQSFNQLNQLEQTVEKTGQTYSQLAAENNALLYNVAYNNDISNALLGSDGNGDRLLGIPGFFWGFCLGLVGIILVYVAIKDPVAKKQEGESAILGCIFLTLIYLVFIYYAIGVDGIDVF
jgi:hypothetical protein